MSLNSSHDLGVILQKIRNIPYTDPSGNNLGKDSMDMDSWGSPLGGSVPLGSDMSFLPGTAVVTAHRYLLAPDAPGRRQHVPGVMVLLVDEPLRGDRVSSPGLPRIQCPSLAGLLLGEPHSVTALVSLC